MRKTFLAFLAGVATAFHPHCLVKPPRAVATLTRHASSVVAVTDAKITSAVNVSSASKSRRRSRRGGGRNRRHNNKVKVVEPLSTRATRAKSHPPQQTTALSDFKLSGKGVLLKPLTMVLDPWKTRQTLREAWTRRHAGGMAHIDFSILRCSNDFELVTRAGKEIEHILDSYFLENCGKNVALPVKMRLARTADGEALSASVQKRMKHLIRTRNQLVHKRDEHAIRHRRAFRQGLTAVLRELAAEADRIELQRQASKQALPVATDGAATTGAETMAATPPGRAETRRGRMLRRMKDWAALVPVDRP